MRRGIAALAGLAALCTAAAAGATVPLPPQGVQSNDGFAASYAAAGVSSVAATEQRVSCYAPEVAYFGQLAPTDGYPGGGMSPCPGATTGEQTTGFATQDVANPAMLVKDHSESDIRVDPANPSHLIGQSKWFVSAEGYNHLNGFYESWDGGHTWPVQGHVPGYEGWTDNTDPVGAFDPWGNFYSLLLPYDFYYSNAGGHSYDNGSKQTNPAYPADVVAVAVHPAAPPGSQSATNWITQHDGHLDYLQTFVHANNDDPDKQWIAVDTNPASSHYGRVYAMWTLFVGPSNPTRVVVQYADARPDGTHTDWSAPQELPTIGGKNFDSYLFPHVTPDGTVWTTLTNNPSTQTFLHNDIYVDWSSDGGVTWQGPRLVASDVLSPTYQNTTFTEGIVNTFATGTKKVAGAYPLYVAYENEDADGFSRVYLTTSKDGGGTWSWPIRVNDDGGTSEALQPNLGVAPSGTVAVAFYDRRLACPAAGAEAIAAGIRYDPNQPYGRANYCVNAAVQFYSPTLRPLGRNIRLSSHTWDPQLNAPKRYCICSSATFLGDYFGVDSGGGSTYTTSISTYGDAGNPSYYQQQVVSRVKTP